MVPLGSLDKSIGDVLGRQGYFQFFLGIADVPSKPTKESTSIGIELPTELVDRLRDFARRDMRSIKSEFIRALQLLLDTFDKSQDTTQMIGAPSMVTLQGETQPLVTGTEAQKSTSVLKKMDEKSFAAFLELIKKKMKDPLLPLFPQFVARCRRQGLTAEQIFAIDDTLDLGRLQQLIEKLEAKAAKGEARQ